MKWVTISMVLLSVIAMEDNTVNGPLKNVIFHHTFEDNTIGKYLEKEWRHDWNNPPWSRQSGGLGEIITEDSNKFLRVHIPKGTFLFDGSGVQWWTALNGEYKELYFKYDLRFSGKFLFENLQGKLPGLAGGTSKMSGGHLPDGVSGWSARYMFHRTALSFYLYHPDNYQNGYYNDKFPIEGKSYYGESVSFSNKKRLEVNKWYTITQRISLNEPGKHNGFIEAYVNGELVVRKEGYCFRDTTYLAIDKIFFSVFLGGSGDRPKGDVYIDLDNFEVFEGGLD